MVNMVKVNGNEILVKEYDGKRVVALSDIDDCYGNNNTRFFCMKFYTGKSRLKENTDYFKLLPSEYKEICCVPCCNKHGGYLLSRSGYHKLLKMKRHPSPLDQVVKKEFDKYFKVAEVVEEAVIKEDIEPKVVSKKEIEPKTETNDLNILNQFMQAQMQLVQMNKELIAEQAKANAELRNMLNVLINKVVANDVKSSEINPIKEGFYEPPIIIRESDDYSAWKKNINKACSLIIGLNGDYKTENEVLHKAYDSLRDQYGIVWDQSKRDFYNAEKRSPTNTQELIYWIERNQPNCKNLLIGKLNTMYSIENKKRKTA